MESFLSTECISVHSCENFTKFWLFYCIYALILATFLYYMKDFISLIKTTVRKILKSCKKEKESDKEIDIAIGIDITGTGGDDIAEEHLEKTSHFTVSVIFTLIVSFYQIKQLMKVDVHNKNSTDFLLVTFITDSLNLEIIAVTYSSYCPMRSLDAISKCFKNFHQNVFADCHIINSLFDKLFYISNFTLFSLQHWKIVIVKAIRLFWSLLHTFANAQL